LTEGLQLRKAESEASGRLLCTSVQRLTTVPHGDGIPTTQATAPPLVHRCDTTISTAADNSN
jgi:hypothetical protein